MLAGFVAGRLHPRERFPFNMPPPPHFAGNKQDLFEKCMHETREKHEVFFNRMEESKNRMADALRAPQIDEAAFSEAVRQIAETNRQLHEEISRNIHDFAASLNHEERIQFADHMKSMRPPPPHKPHGSKCGEK